MFEHSYLLYRKRKTSLQTMLRRMNKKVILGVDIGGSHISAALVDATDGRLLQNTFSKEKVDAHEEGGVIITRWVHTMRSTLEKMPSADLQGIGIAMPGPFNYEQGVAQIDGVHKYGGLYGMNIGAALKNQLDICDDFPLVFENDAACFGLGESFSEEAASCRRIIAITLGTGYGATFIEDHRILKEGEGIPPGGLLYNTPFGGGIAEDYISARGISSEYDKLSGNGKKEPREIAERAFLFNDAAARQVFADFGANLAASLLPWIRSFKADGIVLGGNISQAHPLFLPALRSVLEQDHIHCKLILSGNMELSAISGAAHLIPMATLSKNKKDWRKSSQPLMPQHAPTATTTPGGYDLYPFRRLDNDSIFSGYASLAEWITRQKAVIIDGYIGNDWTAIREQLTADLDQRSIRVIWYETFAFEKNEQQIEEMVSPFLGEPGDVWGKKTSLSLQDFYQDRISAIQPARNYDCTIIIGVGAALCGWDAPIVYIDLPKNELQYRMRAASITNLGSTARVSTAAAGAILANSSNGPANPSPVITSPAEMYKRYYFVDWVVLNAHRQKIKDRIAIVADGQWKEDISWAPMSSITKGLQTAANNVIRVRPWFEAGTWGGQWLKRHIPTLPQDEINYAWSFELIVPENGLVFESGGNLLELSFDWLMEQETSNILGKDSARFGTEFPIRFDFLDTFDGGNLSIQCHPTLNYIQKNFGENITQDETYYILDCEKDAGVWLGFQDNIYPQEFRAVLENSVMENQPVDMEKYVQHHPAHRHDLFLIPNGTVHSSGKNNLVLEISATPYIFTFKMYDWLRLDLNGEPRPINIGHAFNNLNFERKGEKVEKELISHPYLIEEKNGCRLVHLPTHAEHFYDVHRIEFEKEADIDTNGKCHVLMVVEGQSVSVRTAGGETHRFSYAETFVIPAAANSYRLINEGNSPIKIIKAFIK